MDGIYARACGPCELLYHLRATHSMRIKNVRLICARRNGMRLVSENLFVRNCNSLRKIVQENEKKYGKAIIQQKFSIGVATFEDLTISLASLLLL